MRLAYVDESATADRFFLGAVVVDGDCALSLGNELDAVMAKASTAYPQLEHTSELHGHSIFHGKDEWKGMAPRARISVYDQVLRATGEHPDSRHSRLIQAADLITFMYVRITRHTESDPRAAHANARLWSRVSPLVVHDFTWRP
jgi:hypothetical protein